METNSIGKICLPDDSHNFVVPDEHMHNSPLLRLESESLLAPDNNINQQWPRIPLISATSRKDC